MLRQFELKSYMRKLLKIVGKSAGLDKLFRYFYRLLQEREPTPISSKLNTDEVFGLFTDSFGNKSDLLIGLRSRLKPSWQVMVHPNETSGTFPSRDTLSGKIEMWRERLRRVEVLLRAFSFSFDGKDVLEISAHDGATAFALARAGAKTVRATDIAAYYITQAPGGVVCEGAIAAKNVELTRLRGAYATIVGKDLFERVSFLEDDICFSGLPSESVDIVVSWEVLEHLMRPQDAFLHIARVLRRGGIAFHEFNPFFCTTGGHSLCTLDFPWGHARLVAEDFERYLEEIRPREKQLALSFYRNNLNRMTLSQLRQYVEQSGLTLLTLLPWCSKEDLDLMTADVLGQCRRAYPCVGLVDLIAPSVWILLTKNGGHIDPVAAPDKE